jgi:hypothetical protein
MAPDGQPDPYDVHPDRAPLLRGTVLAWQASVVLLCLTALLVAVWLWELVRLQQHLGGFGGSGIGDGAGINGSPGPSILDRIDAGLTTVTFLANAGITLALGLGLRMAGDVVASRLRSQQSSAPDTTLGPDTP